MAQEYRRLAEQLSAASQLFVLTGAGLSTDSGIPDYRDDQGEYRRGPPMQFRSFRDSLPARQRYWARSLVGFSRVDRAKPNAGHHAIFELERRGKVELVVTQNVDGLQQKAGSARVLDLHGRLSLVSCMSCRREFDRIQFQERLREHNPSFDGLTSPFAPDGDAELGSLDTSGFLVPPCTRCGGTLKPAVVFFGESVPKERVDRANEALSRANGVLVVGSSLMVFSGYRFVRAAKKQSLPIWIVNRGKTRADADANLKIEAPIAEVLPSAVQALGDAA